MAEAPGGEGKGPREETHIEPLEDGPFPGVGFAADDGNGADALESENVKDHQSNAGERRVHFAAVIASLILEGPYEFTFAGLGFVVLAYVVNGGHGADKDLASGKGGNDSDADFPIETKGPDNGFDDLPHSAGEAVSEFCAGFLVVESG